MRWIGTKSELQMMNPDDFELSEKIHYLQNVSMGTLSLCCCFADVSSRYHQVTLLHTHKHKPF